MVLIYHYAFPARFCRALILSIYNFLMIYTHTLIIGASVSGLALASCLKKEGIEYVVIEKESGVATPWRNHYDRLRLHTDKDLSNLPFKKFDSNVPRYPTRQQVVDYLDGYSKQFDINPVFNTEATTVSKEGDYWITQTNNDTFKSKYVLIATGPFGKPRPINFNGMESFPGQILHSYVYKTGAKFKGQKVLVVGFGNSACEIAIDLYEQGAAPSMAVRSAINVIPRDVLGIPILRLGLILSRLPPRVADTINAPLMRLLFGDLNRLGLKRKSYGTFEQIRRDGSIPLIDIGTIKHIRKGHIKIYNDIQQIQGKTIHFTDGRKEDFDAIIAAIGYYRDYAKFIHVDKSRFDDLKVPASKQTYFGKDGLYFCGFWIGPTGVIREIALDAQRIAKDIAEKESA